MLGSLKALDRLLRGEFTRPADLTAGKVPVPARKLALACLLLGAVYGACMGLFSATGGREGTGWYVLSSALKVPLLFLLTLLVTFPSLYVFAALADARLNLKDMLRLMLAALAVMLGVLASFGPVTVFFTLSTKSYTFILLLNVAFFALAGIVGLALLNRAVAVVFTDVGGTPRARRVFRIWLLIFGVVGAQMAWILRPFVGNPHLPFVALRGRWSNVFEFLVRTLTDDWR